MAYPEEYRIRTDIFSVKVFCDMGKDGGQWVHEFMTYDFEKAKNHKEYVMMNRLRSFPLVSPKIVHPSHNAVDVFLALGNTIYA